MNTAEQDPASDAALLAQVAAGDLDRPIAELYQRYAPELYALGYRRLLDRGLAEELVQETFIRFWRRAKRFNPTKGRVSDYLFTIATSTATDLRRRPSSNPHASEPHPDTLVDEDHADQRAEALTIREALDSLTPAHREVLTLAHAVRRHQRRRPARRRGEGGGPRDEAQPREGRVQPLIVAALHLRSRGDHGPAPVHDHARGAG